MGRKRETKVVSVEFRLKTNASVAEVRRALGNIGEAGVAILVDRDLDGVETRVARKARFENVGSK